MKGSSVGGKKEEGESGTKLKGEKRRHLRRGEGCGHSGSSSSASPLRASLLKCSYGGSTRPLPIVSSSFCAVAASSLFPHSLWWLTSLLLLGGQVVHTRGIDQLSEGGIDVPGRLRDFDGGREDCNHGLCHVLFDWEPLAHVAPELRGGRGRVGKRQMLG